LSNLAGVHRPIASAATALAIAGSLLLGAGASRAIPPPPPELRQYYGPVRACGDGYAFDAAEGEGYELDRPTRSLWFPGGSISVDHWLYADSQYRDVVHPLGSIRLRSGAALERVRVASRSSPSVEILYLYDTGNRGPFPIISIRSNRFDGSAGDLALLARIRFGEAARALCKDIPEPLQARPERENRDAGWLQPRAHRGPLTLCMVGLALDVGAGESVRLPWNDAVWPRFRVIQGNRLVNVDLLFWRLDGGPALVGFLASAPGVQLLDRTDYNSTTFVADRGSEPSHLQVIFGTPDGRHSLESLPRVSLEFDPTSQAEERRSFAKRLRSRRPEDRCFAPPPMKAGTPPA